jgi:hypothetical protein
MAGPQIRRVFCRKPPVERDSPSCIATLLKSLIKFEI